MTKKENKEEKFIRYKINGVTRIITEYDIQFLEKVMRPDHPYYNSCPKEFLKGTSDDILKSNSILRTCIICNKIYPETLTDRVCPCSLFNKSFMHRLLKKFVDDLKLFMSEKYKKHLEIDLFDVTFNGKEITLITIVNQSKEVDNYVKKNSFNIDSMIFSLFHVKTLFVEGKYKGLENNIIVIDRKYKKDMIEAVESFNKKLGNNIINVDKKYKKHIENQNIECRSTFF